MYISPIAFSPSPLYTGVLPLNEEESSSHTSLPQGQVRVSPLGIFSLPKEFITTGLAGIRAHILNDPEGKLDAALKISSLPISAIQRVQMFATWFFKTSAVIGLNFRQFQFPGALRAWTLPASILGVVFCSIESIYEAVGIGRSISLMKQLPSSIWKGKVDPLSKKKLLIDRLCSLNESFFQIGASERERIERILRKRSGILDKGAERLRLQKALLAVKMGNLERRVRPWMARELERKIPSLLFALRCGNPKMQLDACQETIELFRHLHIQASKKLLVHSIGLLSLLLSLSAFVLSFLACPVLLPVILLGFGALIGVIRYFLEKGIQDQRGWSFSWKDTLPLCIKNCLFPLPS